MFLLVQRAARTKKEEEQGKFTRVYQADDPEDEKDLLATLRDWLVKEHVNRNVFKRRLQAIRVIGNEPAAVDPKVSCKQRLFRGKPTGATTDYGEEELGLAPSTARPSWSAATEQLTTEELAILTDVVSGKEIVDGPPEFLATKSTLSMHTFVSTVIEKTTRGVLVVQLEGAMRVHAKTSWFGLRQLIHDPTFVNEAAIIAFKAAVVFAHYDAGTNSTASTLRSVADAAEWEGKMPTIQGRNVTLFKPLLDGEEPSDNTMDLQAYELQVLNLAGQLDALNVWHLFHGLLGLEVAHLAPTPAGTDGIRDPTLWDITVTVAGCPKILKNKTQIVWDKETNWLHHRAHANPPCTKCGAAAHVARNCAATGSSKAATVLVVQGPQLNVSQEAGEARKQGPEYLQDWLKDMDRQIRERSMMGGEDKNALNLDPSSAPANLVPVYTTSAWTMMRKRFYLRIKAMEIKGLGLHLLIRRELTKNAKIVKHQNPFRLEAPPPSRETESEFYKNTIDFLKIIMSRPWTTAEAEDEEQRFQRATAEADDDMADDDATDDDACEGEVEDGRINAGASGGDGDDGGLSHSNPAVNPERARLREAGVEGRCVVHRVPELHNGTKTDAVILQETRATGDWAQRLRETHARAWGLIPDRITPPLSYWTATPTAAGGVAVLLHPDSPLRALQPLWEDWWGPHFMALSGEIDGETTTLCCVYAPVNKRRREALFTRLRQRRPPHGLILMGGDFNCTLDAELDRSHTSSTNTDSPSLGYLLSCWAMVDTLAPDMLQAETQPDVEDFRARTHTYHYRRRDDSASSRLDRWYVTSADLEQIENAEVVTPCCRSDHDGVILRVSAVHDRATRAKQRAGRRALRFPVPAYAEQAIHAVTSAHVQRLGVDKNKFGTKQGTDAWDAAKDELRTRCLRVTREAAKKLGRSWKQKHRRLQLALATAWHRSALLATGGELECVDEITMRMELMSLDHVEREASIRQRLIDLQQLRATRRQRRTILQYDGGSAGAANRLAQDWLPILQRPALNPLLQDGFFDSLRKEASGGSVPSDNDEFNDFTEAEVLATIEACPRGKASGPDGIPNDWYRDTATDLAPVLAPLFTALTRRGRGWISDGAQCGFVPARQVHDAIDVWSAMQHLGARGLLPSTATAVLLDFAKAYDTLDRRFLHHALEFHGYPSSLIQVVDAMHLATTARFISDGELSDAVDVENGIRQGCPLAPVLFILAIDTLYRRADKEPSITGLWLDETTRVTLSGYADDTTAFLAHPREETALLALLHEFSTVSGLHVNVSKSHAVALHSGGPSPTHAAMQIAVAARTDHLRLLGASIASAPSLTTIWENTLQQIRGILHLAEIKTTNLLQRVDICRAIVMPKLLFVGRHAWPTPQILAKLQGFIHHYAWHGALAKKEQGRRAWMSVAVACLPLADGGIGLPDVRKAFLRLSEATVSRWSTATSAVPAAVGRVLLSYGTSPDTIHAASAFRRPAPAARMALTIAATGLQVKRQHNASPRSPAEIALLTQLLPATGRGVLDERWWKHGWLHCRYDKHADGLAALKRCQETLHGRLNSAVLAGAPLQHAGIFLATPCSEVAGDSFERLFNRDAVLRDVVEIEWVSKNHVRFRSCRDVESMTNLQVMAFRRLCDSVVFNYPELLQPQNPADILQPRPPTAARWQLRAAGTGHELIRDCGGGAMENLGVVTSTKAAARLARAADPSFGKFEPHPSLDAFTPLWSRRSPAGPPAHSTQRPVVGSAGHQEVAARQARAIADDDLIGTALSHVSWRHLARLPASSSAQRLLFHKVKGLRLSGWDRVSKRRGCPHCLDTGSVAGHAFHIMWYCPAAQRLWRLLLEYWQRLGLWKRDDPASRRQFAQAIFCLRLPTTPTAVWGFVDQRAVQLEAVGDVHDALQTVWQQQVLGVMQRLWQWRHNSTDDLAPWTEPVAVSATRSSILSAVYKATTSVDARSLPLVRSIIRGLVRVAATPDASQAGHYLLFFDGG